ncbi:MAG: glutaredoxin 3 [Gammaproteobacteria bacterium]|nr:glutaredoxin 3 [Gammaproteobacteria bacterium]
MDGTVTLYTSRFCGYCVMAQRLLKSRGIDFRTVNIDTDPGGREEMLVRSGRSSVPQIFVGDRHVGGFTDLYHLARRGELDDWLEEADSAARQS